MAFIKLESTFHGSEANSSGVVFSVSTIVGVGSMLIVSAGWDAPSAVATPTVTLDGSNAALITTASGNGNTLHLGLFVFPNPSTSGNVVISFNTTVAFLFFAYAEFSGTTSVSTETIVRTTGASTLIGTTINSTLLFSYPFAAAAGTRVAGNTFTTAHSSMISAVRNYDSIESGWVTGYSESPSDRLVWNSTRESTFVAVGFTLISNLGFVDVTLPKIALSFIAQPAESAAGVAVPSQSLRVILED